MKIQCFNNLLQGIFPTQAPSKAQTSPTPLLPIQFGRMQGSDLSADRFELQASPTVGGIAENQFSTSMTETLNWYQTLNDTGRVDFISDLKATM